MDEELHSHAEDASKTIVSEEDFESEEEFSTICEFDPVKDLMKRTEQRQKNKTKLQKTRYGEPFPHFDPSNKKYLSLPVLCNANKCKNVKDKSDI